MVHQVREGLALPFDLLTSIMAHDVAGNRLGSSYRCGWAADLRLSRDAGWLGAEINTTILTSRRVQPGHLEVCCKGLSLVNCGGCLTAAVGGVLRLVSWHGG